MEDSEVRSLLSSCNDDRTRAGTMDGNVLIDDQLGGCKADIIGGWSKSNHVALHRIGEGLTKRTRAAIIVVGDKEIGRRWGSYRGGFRCRCRRGCAVRCQGNEPVQLTRLMGIEIKIKEQKIIWAWFPIERGASSDHAAGSDHSEVVEGSFTKKIY